MSCKTCSKCERSLCMSYRPSFGEPAIEPKNVLNQEIIQEIYKALFILVPSQIELLAVIGSYGDTQDDQDILEMLQRYNETGSVIPEENMILSVYDTPRDRRSRMKIVK